MAPNTMKDFDIFADAFTGDIKYVVEVKNVNSSYIYSKDSTRFTDRITVCGGGDSGCDWVGPVIQNKR